MKPYEAFSSGLRPVFYIALPVGLLFDNAYLLGVAHEYLPDSLYDDLVNATYVKASRSGGDGSGSGSCLTFAAGPAGLVAFQDDKLSSKERKARTLIFNRDEMRAFVLGCKDGEFDDFL